MIHALPLIEWAFPRIAPEPLTSLKILSRCVQQTAQSQKSALALDVEHLQAKIQSLHAQGAAGQGESLLPYRRRQEIGAMETRLKELEDRLKRETAETDRFYRLQDNLFAHKTAAFRAALNHSDPIRMLLRFHFLIPRQTTRVLREAAKLGIQAAIDSPLIDRMIEKELDNDRRVQEAVQRGKAQLRERQN